MVEKCHRADGSAFLNRLSIEFAPVKDRVSNGVTQRVKARLLGVALVPEGTNAYQTAEVLAVRETDEPDDEPEDEEPTPARSRKYELPPPLNVELLESVGIDTTRGRTKPPVETSEEDG